jgi:isopentenyl-diphosphate delta-isomerase
VSTAGDLEAVARARPPVVLVDADGRATGTADILAAHRAPGLPHRAFTLVLFDALGHVVLARRSAHKPLWPRFDDGTVASHQFPGESNVDAARRRLVEELGATAEPVDVGEVVYRVDDPTSGASPLGLLSENERCAVLVARLAPGAVLAPDAREVEATRRVSLASLLVASPDVWAFHCPWFPLALEALRRRIGHVPASHAELVRPLATPAAEQALHATLARLIPGGQWQVV